MLLRAAAQAVVALLASGVLVTRGWWGVFRFWDWAIPFLVFFLALEIALRRAGGGVLRVFGLGAAFALLFEGVYRKSVLDSMGPLDVDIGATAAAMFDWGMLAVMATHLLSVRFKRPPPQERSERAALGLLALLLAVMAVVYSVKTYFGHYIAERMIGPTWLITDILFVFAAVRLARRYLAEEPSEPPRWTYGLGAFVVWSPGSLILSVWKDNFSWPLPVALLLGLAWTAAVALGFRNLWVSRMFVDETPARASPVVLYAIAWRVIGGAALLLAFSPGEFDERVLGAYALLIDIPSRAAFCYAFFTSRLEV